MSDSVQPHRRQPTRFRHPWDSPGKNTGVGCHFLLQCMKLKGERSRSVVSDSLRPHGLQPTRLLHPWDFPGKSTGVGGHCLLQNEMTKTLQNMLPTPPLLLLFSCSVVSDSLRPHGLQPTRLLHPWDFPGKSTGVGCCCLLWLPCSTYCK